MVTGDEAEGTYRRVSWSGIFGDVSASLAYDYDEETKTFEPPEEVFDLPYLGYGTLLLVQPMGAATIQFGRPGVGPQRPVVQGESAIGYAVAYESAINRATITIVTQVNTADPGDPPSYEYTTLVGQADVTVSTRIGGYGEEFPNSLSYWRSNAFGQVSVHRIIGISARTNGTWERDGVDVSEEVTDIYGLTFPPGPTVGTSRPIEDYNLGWSDVPIAQGWSRDYPGFFSQGPT